MRRDASLFSCAKAEIIERHAFFVRWFTEASLKPSEFERCEAAFDAHFRMITPDGMLHGRAEVLRRLRKAKASMELKFEIAVEGVKELWLGEEAGIVGYVEAQLIDGRRTRRRSSALFERCATAPNGVAWRHLHETWVEASGAREHGHEREKHK
jgi:hypothetical protein